MKGRCWGSYNGFDQAKKRSQISLRSLLLRFPAFNKKRICSILGVSRAGIYKASNGLATKDEFPRTQILSVLSVHPGYGHRGIAISLGVGKKRVRRVMRLNGIKPYKSWGFHLLEVEKQIYLSGNVHGSFHQRNSRLECVHKTHTKEFVLEAFWDAVMNSGLPKIVHTDQGTEYCSKECIELMDTLNVQISMSKKSSLWENAYQESFYNNFKTDLGLEFERFETQGELIEAIHQAINYYNTQRIHTTLKTPPVRFRLQHLY